MPFGKDIALAGDVIPNVAKVEDAPRQIPLIGEMGYPRLSHRVNNVAVLTAFRMSLGMNSSRERRTYSN